MPKGVYPRRPPYESFWDKVNRDGPISISELGPCWMWLGGKQGKGYGTFTIAGKQTTAHRFAYEFEVGPIPSGLQIDHLCRNKSCVNPSHLEAVSARQNLMRGNTRAAENAKKTHCPLGHPYNEPNTKWDHRRRIRICRTCANRKRREWGIRTDYKH